MAYEVPKGCIIYDGKPWPCYHPVKLWRDTGLEFSPGKGGRTRAKPPQMVIWHHTGGEQDARGVYRTLTQKKLGIEFIIDQEGEIWQCCDPARVDTFDAGSFNSLSVGVEFCSRGLAPDLPSRPRKRYTGRFRGQGVEWLELFPAQLEAGHALAVALSAALGIPPVVRTETDRIPDAKLTSYRGHLGHMHCHATKLDPGPQFFSYLLGRGFLKPSLQGWGLS